MKMRIDDIMDLVKFVEASAPEVQRESFQRHLFLWRNSKMDVTAPIGSTMVRSPIILSVACFKILLYLRIYFRHYLGNNRSQMKLGHQVV